MGKIVITIRNSQGGGKPAVTRQGHSQGGPGVLVDPPFFLNLLLGKTQHGGCHINLVSTLSLTYFFWGPPLKNTGYPPERAHFNYPFIFALQITTCFSKIFNECPLHIYCTGLWVNPSTGGETEIILIVFTVIFIDIWQMVSCYASKNLCDRPSLHFGRT